MGKKIIWGRKKRIIDRKDGWRVISRDPLFSLVPHFMRNRCDSQVLFNDSVDMTETEKLIRRLRHETEMKELSTLHILIATMTRLIAQYPCLNRFIAGRKIYARNSLSYAFNIKRKLSLDSEELIVIVNVEPSDDLKAIYDKVNAAMVQTRNEESPDAGKFSKALSVCPSWILKICVGLIRWLDDKGLLPQALMKISPFHCSMYINDLGSIGIQSVYHHLFNFGTCSMFVSLGKKSTEKKEKEDGSVSRTHNINLRVTVDERIVDGYYFASAMRTCAKLMKNPEVLLNPPEKVNEDPEIPPRMQ